MQKAQVPNKNIHIFNEGKNIEQAYGCTLITYAQTNNYWFSFQIGDGKCVVFEENGNWKEPIPTDDNCIGNITTSLCQSNAIDSFRYCYSGEKNPATVFLSSDGIDDSYSMKDLSFFYKLIIQEFVNSGFDKTYEQIKMSLPIISKKGSQDDMSLAGVIDFNKAKQIYNLLKEDNKIEKSPNADTEGEAKPPIHNKQDNQNMPANSTNEIEKPEKTKTELIKLGSSRIRVINKYPS